MPLVLYTLLRVALIALVYLVLALFGLTGPVWFVAAVVIALLLSYAAFRPVRDRAALWLADRARRRKDAGTRISESLDADADVEDAAVDAVTDAVAAQAEDEAAGSGSSGAAPAGPPAGPPADPGR